MTLRRFTLLLGTACALTAVPVRAEIIGVFEKGDVLITISDLATGACTKQGSVNWRNARYTSPWNPGYACWVVDKDVVTVCSVVANKIETRDCWYISVDRFVSPASLK